MKGTAHTITNVKPMAGGVTNYQLQVGDYVYGAVGTTDLMGFTHLYRKNGTIQELGTPHKAWSGGLTLTNETEPATPPPVDPPPPLPTADVDVRVNVSPSTGLVTVFVTDAGLAKDKLVVFLNDELWA
jgi:hypothetical protein